jgi:hypothetical protein
METQEYMKTLSEKEKVVKEKKLTLKDIFKIKKKR